MREMHERDEEQRDALQERVDAAAAALLVRDQAAAALLAGVQAAGAAELAALQARLDALAGGAAAGAASGAALVGNHCRSTVKTSNPVT